MAFVVTEPCFGCKSKACLQVCPVESFHEGESMLFINPDKCIDCDACAAECPTNAIFHDEDVPEEWQEYIALNAEMSAVCPVAV
ncbi:MAG: 4Fe-4S binding protein [Planctomycetota bacterium]|nr:4Fe-4S binding protein [Planctomycetota bacterium]